MEVQPVRAHSSRASRRSAGAVCFITLLSLFPHHATAQWATDYHAPFVLYTGPDVRAGSVLARGDGSAMFCYAGDVAGVPKLLNPTFGSGSTMFDPGMSLFSTTQKPAKVQLLTAPFSSTYSYHYARYVPPAIGLSSYAYIQQRLDNLGHLVDGIFQSDYLFQTATRVQNGSNLAVSFSPMLGKINAYQNNALAAAPVDLVTPNATDFTLIPGESNRVLYACVQQNNFPETPAQIMVGYIDCNTPNPTISLPLKLADQPGEDQQSPKFADLTGSQSMVAWIGSFGSLRRLYVNTLSLSGVPLTTTRVVLSDIQDFVTVGSTLGLPVFAACQRNVAATPVTDTLLVGLVEPVAGTVLSIPLAVGQNIKPKHIRQEANGDFSVVYSILEGGTNLLKVRRISGTSAATLWETTVCDLGSASDELLHEYPNTFVDGNAQGVLYILARQDKPYTNISSFQAIRLRADGQMGTDPLVPPQNLHTTTVAPGDVEIAWDDNNTGETNYIIGRTESDFTSIEILDGVIENSTSYIDTTAVSPASYDYYVAAYHAPTGTFSISEPLHVELVPVE